MCQRLEPVVAAVGSYEAEVGAWAWFMSSPSDRRALGLPPDVTFHHLATSLPGRCIVVLASRAADPVRSDRIFIRGYDASQYTELRWPPGTNSFDAPVISHRAPELYVLGQHWTDIEGVSTNGGAKGPGRGSNGTGIFRVALPDGAIELVHPGRQPPSTPPERPLSDPWVVSQLLGLTPDGTRLVVVMGGGRVELATTTWSYRIATFEPSTGAWEVLASLPAVFA